MSTRTKEGRASAVERLSLELSELEKVRKLVVEKLTPAPASAVTRYLDNLRDRLRADRRRLRELPALGRPPANERRQHLAMLDALLEQATGMKPMQRGRSLAKVLGDCTEHDVRRARGQYRAAMKVAVRDHPRNVRALVAPVLRTFTPSQRKRYRQLLKLRTK